MTPTTTRLETDELRADAGEQAAWTDLLLSAPAPLRRTLDLRVEPIGRVALMSAAGIDSRLFNRTTGSPETPEGLEAALALRPDRIRFFVRIDPDDGARFAPLLTQRGRAPVRRRRVRAMRGPGGRASENSRRSRWARLPRGTRRRSRSSSPTGST